MLSVIEVICPHCGAKGQIMLPPIGAIIVGPCPECRGLVVVFCGQVLPLDKEIMLGGTHEEQREHLMGVLTDFLRERVAQLIADESGETDAAVQDAEPAEPVAESPRLEKRPAIRRGTPILPEEIEAFVGTELDLLDDRDYFKTIFG